jgi:hypothetical protein
MSSSEESSKTTLSSGLVDVSAIHDSPPALCDRQPSITSPRDSIEHSGVSVVNVTVTLIVRCPHCGQLVKVHDLSTARSKSGGVATSSSRDSLMEKTFSSNKTNIGDLTPINPDML